MSSFNKAGQRQARQVLDRKTKKHVKAFYKIIGEMEDISKQLDPSIEYNEENINEYVLPIYGRELDHMEKFIILGKMSDRGTNIGKEFHERKEDNAS